MSRRSMLVLLLTLTIVPNALAEFVHNIDMNNGRTTNLVSTENVRVYDEIVTGSTKYWGPTSTSVIGSVTYGYNFVAPIQTASFYANLLAFTDNDEIWLDVSTDNMNFTNIFNTRGRAGENLGLGPASTNPGLPPPSFDLTNILAGSNSAFIRARMVTGTTGGFSRAQFMRTADNIPGFEAPNVYQFSAAVPEPSSAMLLAGLGAAFCMRRRRK